MYHTTAPTAYGTHPPTNICIYREKKRALRLSLSIYICIYIYILVPRQRVVPTHQLKQHTSAYVSIRQHTSAYVRSYRCPDSVW